MTDSPLQRLFWRVVDALDYLLTLVSLRILDALAGPEPETPADLRRKRDREQLERAFPEIHCKEPDAAISHSTDRVSPEDGSPAGAETSPRGSPFHSGRCYAAVMDQFRETPTLQREHGAPLGASP